MRRKKASPRAAIIKIVEPKKRTKYLVRFDVEGEGSRRKWKAVLGTKRLALRIFTPELLARLHLRLERALGFTILTMAEGFPDWNVEYEEVRS